MISRYTRVPAGEYPLTLDEFKQVLEIKLKSEVVGEVGRSNSCPIANVLKEKGVDACVGNRITITDDKSFDNPEWVTKFTIEIDGCKVDYTPITVEECTKVIDNLYICTVCNTYNPEGTNCGKKDNCPW